MLKRFPYLSAVLTVEGERRGWKAEAGGRKTEDSRRNAEGGRRKAEGGRRKAEGGRSQAEGGKNKKWIKGKREFKLEWTGEAFITLIKRFIFRPVIIKCMKELWREFACSVNVIKYSECAQIFKVHCFIRKLSKSFFEPLPMSYAWQLPLDGQQDG